MLDGTRKVQEDKRRIGLRRDQVDSRYIPWTWQRAWWSSAGAQSTLPRSFQLRSRRAALVGINLDDIDVLVARQCFAGSSSRPAHKSEQPHWDTYVVEQGQSSSIAALARSRRPPPPPSPPLVPSTASPLAYEMRIWTAMMTQASATYGDSRSPTSSDQVGISFVLSLQA